MNALMMVLTCLQAEGQDQPMPAVAENPENPVVRIDAFRIDDAYQLTLYRKVEDFTFYLGTRESRESWMRFWLVAEDLQSTESWIPWAIY